jgi:hypothetical protein
MTCTADHCAKSLLPWVDGMLEADEKYFAEHGAFGPGCHRCFLRAPLNPFTSPPPTRRHCR